MIFPEEKSRADTLPDLLPPRAVATRTVDGRIRRLQGDLALFRQFREIQATILAMMAALSLIVVAPLSVLGSALSVPGHLATAGASLLAVGTIGWQTAPLVRLQRKIQSARRELKRLNQNADPEKGLRP